MIKFKMIKPFVTEMLILLFVVVSIIVGLLTGKFIEITIKPHLITFSFFLIAIGLFLSLFSRVINLGARAMFDYIFQSTKTDNYEFIEELPYRASVFSEKFASDSKQTYGMYYLIQVKKDGKVSTFISSSFLDLKPGKKYILKTTTSSHIVLEWSNSKV